MEKPCDTADSSTEFIPVPENLELLTAYMSLLTAERLFLLQVLTKPSNAVC